METIEKPAEEERSHARSFGFFPEVLGVRGEEGDETHGPGDVFDLRDYRPSSESGYIAYKVLNVREEEGLPYYVCIRSDRWKDVLREARAAR